MFWFMVVSFYLQGLYANHYKKVIQRVEQNTLWSNMVHQFAKLLF